MRYITTSPDRARHLQPPLHGLLQSAGATTARRDVRRAAAGPARRVPEPRAASADRQLRRRRFLGSFCLHVVVFAVNIILLSFFFGYYSILNICFVFVFIDPKRGENNSENPQPGVISPNFHTFPNISRFIALPPSHFLGVWRFELGTLEVRN